MNHRPGGNRGHQFRDPLVASTIEHNRRVHRSGGVTMLALIGLFKLLMFVLIGVFKLLKFVWSKRKRQSQTSGDVIDSSSEGIQYKVYDPDNDD
jgi:hypothetical protein